MLVMTSEHQTVNREVSVPADRGAELIQAPSVTGGAVVQFGQAVHPL